ncbi:DUF2254 domain-containing protein [Guptibacillus algicola]|uniref:DUF2254 domain-containing protein n=1 Tax=Guptibacillus algicola TaxID=225844 RepID=UPI001CD700E2|nr:DUF2254 domain-containing protein [Alkalihalobacillus algicola]MCA0988447.1 DUF2254 domain-containing protein [Alkalihalobacillus algicola]
MIKKIILHIKESIWFIPGTYSVLSFLLAVVVILIDTVYYEEVQQYIPSFLTTTVDLAQTTLASLSAALLTMTTITFSTIMVVLTTYSSQFSPRTLKNFTTNQTTMRVLGIFMGGFVYSILTLLFMRKELIDHEVIAATIGVITAFVCLAFFAFFLHRVASSIQVSNLIKELTDDSLTMIREATTALDNGGNKISNSKPHFPSSYVNVTEVNATNYGYVKLIDYEGLLSLAINNDYVIEVNEYIGSFVTPESNILSIYHCGDEANVAVNQFITVGDERSSVQDIDFGIQKMVEIALRAISPGINDPNTAIACIDYLRLPLVEAFQLGGNYITYYEEGNARIVGSQKNVDELLYSTFYQISFYGKEDVSILLAIFDTLIYISQNSNDVVKKKVLEISEYVMNRFDQDALDVLDRKHVDAKRVKLVGI